MSADIQFRVATIDDLKSVYELNDRFNLKNIVDHETKFGFVTNTYSMDELTSVINNQDMVVMVHNNLVKGCLYVINTISQSDILRTRWNRLIDEGKVDANARVGFGARIIIDKSFRHYRYPADLFLKFFELNADRYDCLFSGINRLNTVSLKALIKAYKADIVDETAEYMYILFHRSHNIPLYFDNDLALE